MNVANMIIKLNPMEFRIHIFSSVPCYCEFFFISNLVMMGAKQYRQCSHSTFDTAHKRQLHRLFLLYWIFSNQA